MPQQGGAASSPYLDDAFYAMVASHFPAMDSVPSAQLPACTSTSTPSLANSSQPARASVNNDSSSFHSTTTHDQLNDAQLNPYTAYPQGSGHRPSTSIYHPQPTRSGRVPIPPPEEELQAMLAMDNYFEFPSESESDDEDFVLPASELNDDDDDQEDDTPRHETPAGPSTVGATAEPDEYNEGILDSAEYDWLMENLSALERNGSVNNGDQATPDGNPIASTSRAVLEPQSDTSRISLPFQSGRIDETPHNSQVQPSRSTVPDASPPITSTPRHQAPGSPASRTRARSAATESRTAPLSELQSLPQQKRASASRTKSARATTTSTSSAAVTTDASASKPAKQTRTAASRKRKASVATIDEEEEEFVSESETGYSTAHNTSRLPASPNARLEDKRRRNAEQSRTFRERQRARKEANEQKLQALQEENRQLREDLQALQRRLEAYEGSESRPARAKATAKATTATRRTKTTKTSRAVNTLPPSDDEDAPPPRKTVNHEPAPASTSSALTFEDLGKFVAGLVQGKTQLATSETRAPAAREDDSSERSTPAPSVQQNPLMLLTQLLSSHQ
ncbi:hypothetical protein P389DRAFT_83587 [Cystobasidium minutum MCA 4210]|uniref:uncharacterized protein n=1 Tax=Cystobasidium minutum MCA 4210 TaxID=1397322 RepID=UPI0034CFC360|eukprot:jgi/Rhomi1/83587/CE83586_223